MMFLLDCRGAHGFDRCECDSRDKTILVFGVFDLLHPGHCVFLSQALCHGKQLIVVVTPDVVVERLKGRMPCEDEKRRMAHVRDAPGVVYVELGDNELGTYAAIKKYKPDVICLGYDQCALGKDINKKIAAGELPAAQLVMLLPYEPNKYHTSIIRAQLADKNPFNMDCPNQ